MDLDSSSWGLYKTEEKLIVIQKSSWRFSGSIVFTSPAFKIQETSILYWHILVFDSFAFWFLYYCKFLFNFVQSSYAGIKIQLLKNISRSRFWKKSKINNLTSHFAHKIHWACKKYFLTAYLNSWCNFLSFDRSHYIFQRKNKNVSFLAIVANH